MDPVNEIKARLPIEELVSQYCQLTKKGRTLKTVCPFHNDTHPSLTVSPDKGIAYCFACQTGGDIFSFYQAIEGVDFPQALKDLAEKTGVELPKEHMKAGPKKGEKDRLRACLEETLSFYREHLLKNERAQKYLAERAIPQELVDQFQIGCAPDSFDATYSHLLKIGYSRKEITTAGLGIQKELQQERIYDRFRNRLIFPIHDYQGNLIGFGGRTLGNDDAKYINSPDSPLYNKSTALFGLSRAKEMMRGKKTVILVEGYFDVIAFHRIGITNVVAVSGTALTEQHVKVIKRYVDTVALCLDADRAGREASERAFMLCSAEDIHVTSLALPTGKDPDECARCAPDALQDMVTSGGRPFMEQYLTQLAEEKLERRESVRRSIPLLQSIKSAVEREACIKMTATALGATPTALEDDIRNFKYSPEPQKMSTIHKTSSLSAFELILGLLLAFPELQPAIENLIEPLNEKEKELYTAIKAAYTAVHADSDQSGHSPISLDDLSKQCREHASIVQLYCEEHFADTSESMRKRELLSMCRSVNQQLLRSKQIELLEKIRSAQKDGKQGEEEKLLTEYQHILKLAKLSA